MGDEMGDIRASGEGDGSGAVADDGQLGVRDVEAKGPVGVVNFKLRGTSKVAAYGENA